MNDPVNPNHIGDDSVDSTRMATQSTPPSLAPKTAHRTSLGHRLQRALTGGPNRRFPGLHSPLGGTTSPSLLLNRRLAFPTLALLALLTASLLFLLPGGSLWAQDAETIEYLENGTGSVATYTAVDPEGTAITSWSLGGTDAGAFTIEGGVLRFKKSPDYEMPTDVAGTSPSTAAADDNEYEITVQAMDSTGKTGMQEVTVEVIDKDEAGTVTLSARRPQTGVVFTASLTDLDATASSPVTTPKWQWAKSRSKNGAYTDIDGAEMETYEPTDASGKSDVGYYLRATVSYTDPEGSGKTAMMKSDYTVQQARGTNNAPEFAEDQDPVMDGDQADAARKVAENTAAGVDIGAPVAATDEDDDILTYTLTGTDADFFAIDRATGQLKTKAALDEETKNSYTVVVRATDPAGVPQASSAVAANSDEVTVNIAVTDVGEPPVVAGDEAVTFNENTGVIDTALGDYTASDPDDGAPTPTWSVAGPDGSKFTATGGDLQFKAKPDYEDPTDADTDNVYEVTVQATDGDSNRGMKMVKVTVVNENESGVVTLSKTQPRVGIAVTASLTDPDGSISSLTWQWSNNNGVIEDANSDTYTPVTGDVGDTLTATASYTDGHGPSKTAEKGSVNVVAVDTRNKPPAFADQDAETDGTQNDMATRKVDENTEAVAADDALADGSEDTADNVGGVVMATDPDPNAETPTYTLGGADAAKFRVRANGQIEVGSGTELDYETKQTYMVTLKAEDSFGSSSSIDVTIEVNPIDEMPDVSGEETPEYLENGTGSVATYTAVDPEGTAITSWSLGGTDAGAFTIEGGVLRFKKSPDYEMPTDVAGTSPSTAAADDNEYEITVQAMDSTGKTGMQEVTVEVIDKDEAGTVTLSARRPQTGVVFTASLTDLDATASSPVTTPKWQWAKSRSKNGAYTDIDGAEMETYEPTDASGKSDVGYYLRATVSYTDPEGSGKTAMMKSDYTVQQARGTNNAPEFAEDQDPVMDGDQADAARKVAENTAAGVDIGAPVAATDEDDDILTYTLTGTDADFFAIDRATGQLKTKAALDEETKNSYTVVVRATDPAGVPQASSAVAANSDEVTVNIAVTDVGEPPVVAGDEAVTFNENTGVIDTALGDYTASDPDDGAPTPTWSVAGPDGSKFTATGGDLQFKAKPDYEDPTDADTDNVYEVTVQATDGDSNRGMKMVKVTVVNENESGVVTLSKTQPRVGIAVTASLTDPDGSISSLTWQWSNNNGVIEDANSDTYTPVTGDVGDTLTATASYTDGHGPSKTAEKGSVNVVAVDTRNKPPAFADQDAETDGTQNDMATRKVDENTEAVAADDALADGSEDTADNVGGVVMATDPDPNAETPTYTLGGADAAKFRVRANGQIEVGSGTELDYETKQTYMVTLKAEDSFGSSSSIDVTIEVNPIDEVPVIRRVDSENQPPEFHSDADTRSVVEGTPAGEDIGTPVAATDADDPTLTYTLGGTDTAFFSIDSDTGQLMTLAALDYETKATYSVTVTASDSGGLSDSIDVTITVTDVDENLPPEFPSAATTREVAENTVAGEDIGAPVAASDADDAALTYTLSGTDAASFDIDQATGQLKTKADLDYETKASYAVTVTATDGDTASDSIDVTITVTDVDEMVTGDDLVDRYDADDSGDIDKTEVLKAINDYLFGEGDEAISKPEVLRLINIYLFGG